MDKDSKFDVILTGGTGFSGSGLLIDFFNFCFNIKVINDSRLSEFSIHHDDFSIVKIVLNFPMKLFSFIFWNIKLTRKLIKIIFIYYPLVYISYINKLTLNRSLLSKNTGFLSKGIHKSHGIDYSFKSLANNFFYLYRFFFTREYEGYNKLARDFCFSKTNVHKKYGLVVYDKSIPDNILGLDILNSVMNHISIFMVRNPVIQYVQKNKANNIYFQLKDSENLKKHLDEIFSIIVKLRDLYDEYPNLFIISFDEFLYDDGYRNILISKLGLEVINPYYDFNESLSNNLYLKSILDTLVVNQGCIDKCNDIISIQNKLILKSKIRMLE